MRDIAGTIPLIDVAPLVAGRARADRVGAEIASACERCGFFYAVGHGVDAELQAQLELAARRFFARERAEKMSIRMARGGRAWRGYFPVGGEMTSGRPDRKEGLYFGADLDDDHPLVAARTPLHGANLYPDDDPELRDAVADYIAAMTALGHRLMEGIARGLGLDPDYFAARYTRDPLVLFRIFHYPPLGEDDVDAGVWSVGEHTDYGVLTMLLQDDTGGLQIRSRGEWVDAPPIPGSLVCNIGDMLEKMTAGRFRSTPHRVRNASARGRLSFPFFFDPAFDAKVGPIAPGAAAPTGAAGERWDGASVHDFAGTYGDYLLAKVGKVFPDLGRDVL